MESLISDGSPLVLGTQSETGKTGKSLTLGLSCFFHTRLSQCLMHSDPGPLLKPRKHPQQLIGGRLRLRALSVSSSTFGDEDERKPLVAAGMERFMVAELPARAPSVSMQKHELVKLFLCTSRPLPTPHPPPCL